LSNIVITATRAQERAFEDPVDFVRQVIAGRRVHMTAEGEMAVAVATSTARRRDANVDRLCAAGVSRRLTYLEIRAAGAGEQLVDEEVQRRAREFSDMLERLPGRKRLVLVTGDGNPNGGVAEGESNFPAVLRSALMHGVPVEVVAWRGRLSGAYRALQREHGIERVRLRFIDEGGLFLPRRFAPELGTPMVRSREYIQGHGRREPFTADPMLLEHVPEPEAPVAPTDAATALMDATGITEAMQGVERGARGLRTEALRDSVESCRWTTDAVGQQASVDAAIKRRQRRAEMACQVAQRWVIAHAGRWEANAAVPEMRERIEAAGRREAARLSEALPVYAQSDYIADALGLAVYGTARRPGTGPADKVHVALVTGSTGSGKSTVLPVIIAERCVDVTSTRFHGRRVLVSQPKQAHAKQLLRRVRSLWGAGERGEAAASHGAAAAASGASRRVDAVQALGDPIGDDDCTTRITFGAHGTLLARLVRDLQRFSAVVADHDGLGRLTTRAGVSDDDIAAVLPLQEYGTIIVDEAHERTMELDLVLGCLELTMCIRNAASSARGTAVGIESSPLKLILASATADESRTLRFLRRVSASVESAVESARGGMRFADAVLGAAGRATAGGSGAAGAAAASGAGGDVDVDPARAVPAIHVAGTLYPITDEYCDAEEVARRADRLMAEDGGGGRVSASSVAKAAALAAWTEHQRLGEREGDVLIFLPGRGDIDKAEHMFKAHASLPLKGDQRGDQRGDAGGAGGRGRGGDRGRGRGGDRGRGRGGDRGRGRGGDRGRGRGGDRGKVAGGAGHAGRTPHVHPAAGGIKLTTHQLTTGSVDTEPLLRPGPRGTRRVIFATNFAESSITIPGLAVVIDSGVSKCMQYDSALRVEVLRLQQISRASALQRRGRCGRTGPGRCVRLYTRHRYESMLPFHAPDVANKDLSGAMCIIMAARLDPVTFPWFSRPPSSHLGQALSSLARSDACSLLQEADRHSVVSTSMGRLVGRLACHMVLPAAQVLAAGLLSRSSDTLAHVEAAAVLAVGGPRCLPSLVLEAGPELGDVTPLVRLLRAARELAESDGGSLTPGMGWREANEAALREADAVAGMAQTRAGLSDEEKSALTKTIQRYMRQFSIARSAAMDAVADIRDGEDDDEALAMVCLESVLVPRASASRGGWCTLRPLDYAADEETTLRRTLLRGLMHNVSVRVGPVWLGYKVVRTATAIGADARAVAGRAGSGGDLAHHVAEAACMALPVQGSSLSMLSEHPSDYCVFASLSHASGTTTMALTTPCSIRDLNAIDEHRVADLQLRDGDVHGPGSHECIEFRGVATAVITSLLGQRGELTSELEAAIGYGVRVDSGLQASTAAAAAVMGEDAAVARGPGVNDLFVWAPRHRVVEVRDAVVGLLTAGVGSMVEGVAGWGLTARLAVQRAVIPASASEGSAGLVIGPGCEVEGLLAAGSPGVEVVFNAQRTVTRSRPVDWGRFVTQLGAWLATRVPAGSVISWSEDLPASARSTSARVIFASEEAASAAVDLPASGDWDTGAWDGFFTEGDMVRARRIAPGADVGATQGGAPVTLGQPEPEVRVTWSSGRGQTTAEVAWSTDHGLQSRAAVRAIGAYLQHLGELAAGAAAASAAGAAAAAGLTPERVQELLSHGHGAEGEADVEGCRVSVRAGAGAQACTVELSGLLPSWDERDARTAAMALLLRAAPLFGDAAMAMERAQDAGPVTNAAPEAAAAGPVTSAAPEAAAAGPAPAVALVAPPAAPDARQPRLHPTATFEFRPVKGRRLMVGGAVHLMSRGVVLGLSSRTECSFDAALEPLSLVLTPTGERAGAGVLTSGSKVTLVPAAPSAGMTRLAYDPGNGFRFGLHDGDGPTLSGQVVLRADQDGGGAPSGRIISPGDGIVILLASGFYVSTQRLRTGPVVLRASRMPPAGPGAAHHAHAASQAPAAAGPAHGKAAAEAFCFVDRRATHPEQLRPGVKYSLRSANQTSWMRSAEGDRKALCMASVPGELGVIMNRNGRDRENPLCSGDSTMLFCPALSKRLGLAEGVGPSVWADREPRSRPGESLWLVVEALGAAPGTPIMTGQPVVLSESRSRRSLGVSADTARSLTLTHRAAGPAPGGGAAIVMPAAHPQAYIGSLHGNYVPAGARAGAASRPRARVAGADDSGPTATEMPWGELFPSCVTLHRRTGVDASVTASRSLGTHEPQCEMLIGGRAAPVPAGARGLVMACAAADGTPIVAASWCSDGDTARFVDACRAAVGATLVVLGVRGTLAAALPVDVVTAAAELTSARDEVRRSRAAAIESAVVPGAAWGSVYSDGVATDITDGTATTGGGGRERATDVVVTDRDIMRLAMQLGMCPGFQDVALGQKHALELHTPLVNIGATAMARGTFDTAEQAQAAARGIDGMRTDRGVIRARPRIVIPVAASSRGVGASQCAYQAVLAAAAAVNAEAGRPAAYPVPEYDARGPQADAQIGLVIDSPAYLAAAHESLAGQLHVTVIDGAADGPVLGGAGAAAAADRPAFTAAEAAEAGAEVRASQQNLRAACRSKDLRPWKIAAQTAGPGASSVIIVQGPRATAPEAAQALVRALLAAQAARIARAARGGAHHAANPTRELVLNAATIRAIMRNGGRRFLARMAALAASDAMGGELPPAGRAPTAVPGLGRVSSAGPNRRVRYGHKVLIRASDGRLLSVESGDRRGGDDDVRLGGQRRTNHSVFVIVPPEGMEGCGGDVISPLHPLHLESHCGTMLAGEKSRATREVRAAAGRSDTVEANSVMMMPLGDDADACYESPLAIVAQAAGCGLLYASMAADILAADGAEDPLAPEGVARLFEERGGAWGRARTFTLERDDDDDDDDADDDADAPVPAQPVPRVHVALDAAHRTVTLSSKHSHLDLVAQRIQQRLAELAAGTPAAADDEPACAVCYDTLITTALSSRGKVRESLHPYVFVNGGDDADPICQGCASEHLRACAEASELLTTASGAPCALADAMTLLDHRQARSTALAVLRRTTPHGGKIGGRRFLPCPGAGCGAPLVIASAAGVAVVARCSSCGTDTCGGCGKAAHPGLTCADVAHRGEVVHLTRRAQEHFRAGERGSARPCPSCFDLVERSTGCEKMQCRCGAVWCFGCGWPWRRITDEMQVYGHLGRGGFYDCPHRDASQPWWDLQGRPLPEFTGRGQAARRGRAARRGADP